MSNANATGARGLQYTGTLAAAPPNCNFVDRDPTPYDNKGYSLLDQWLNTITKDGWVLVSLAGTPESRGPLANWVKFTGAGLPGILSITGDDGIAIFPNSAGNFNILGTFPLETFTGDPSFPNSLLINVNIATEMSLGVTTLAGATVTIAGTSQTTAVDPRGLSAKLGTQTEFGVAYGNGGIGTVIGWTNSGTVTQVLTSNGPTDPPTFQDAQEGFNVLEAVRVATTGALTVVYNNGAAGVGATLTNAGVQAALAIDGVSLSVNDRVLVKDQASQFQNGIYTVTAIGSGATNWVMTRSLDYDMAPSQIQPGNIVPVVAGTTNANTIWLQTATVTTIGTDPIIFVGFGSQPVPLPIALGGTNTTSFSVVNGVVVYNGTELTTVASTGTAGQILTSNGSAALPSFQTFSGGSASIVTIYDTPGPFSWTKNINTKSIEVWAWGGGGGGGGGTNNLMGGGGGGCGGAMYYSFYENFVGATLTGSVGSGGIGGAGGASGIASAGGKGTASYFGDFGTGVFDNSGRTNSGGVSGVCYNVGNFFLPTGNSTDIGQYNGGKGANGATGFAVTPTSRQIGSMLGTAGGGGGWQGSFVSGAAGGAIFSAATGTSLLAGGTAGGGNGNDASLLSTYMCGGTGGGGGNSSGTSGQVGGIGGFPGGGGGGGASGTTSSGSGGAGSAGLVIVIEHA